MHNNQFKLESSDSKKNIIEYLKKNMSDIISLLLNYAHEPHASIHKSSMSIDKDSLSIDSEDEGALCIQYAEYYYYGCDDVNTEVKREITLDLSIDNQNKLICLLGPELHERDYVDEI